MIQIILKIALFATLGFCSVILLAYLFQGRMIFIQQKTMSPEAQNFKAYEVVFEHKAARLHGWLVSLPTAEKDDPLVIYYGGNAEELSGNLTDFCNNGIKKFLMVNYRGYGKSTGVPSEELLIADALFIFDQMLHDQRFLFENIVLMGRSLGTGVAVQVAGLRKVAGVVLITPFDSLVNTAKFHYPFLPVNLLLKHRFDSVAMAPKINVPMLALIAERDQIIPNKSSQNLVKKWGGPLKSVLIEDAGHNDIHLHPQYWRALNSFLNSVKSNLKKN